MKFDSKSRRKGIKVWVSDEERCLLETKVEFYGYKTLAGYVRDAVIYEKVTYSKSKTKDYYHQYKEQSWKEKINEDVENILPKCTSMEEFLDELAILGYEIKRGKNLSVKCLGMERFARLSTINSKYSVNNLYGFFKIQNILCQKKLQYF